MAILKIYNDIATEEDKACYQWNGSDAVCFKDIVSFIESIPEDDTKIDIQINCRGGNVMEGWAIYDALRMSGKEIGVELVGRCASMATIIMMSAPKEKRVARQNASLCIHSPFIPEFTLAGSYHADDLRKMADDLETEKSKFLDLYVERTGSDREVLESLMNEDKYIDMTQAKDLGFIDHILAPLSASKNNSINTKVMNKKKKSVKQVLADLAVALGVKDELVSMELTTESGDTLTVERESGEPSVGDLAEPDGEFVMPDGSTIVVKEGVITEIIPSETTEPEGNEDEVENLKAQIEALTQQLSKCEEEKKNALKLAKSKDEIEILNAVKIAGGREWLMQAKSNYVVERRVGGSEKEENKKQTNSLRAYVENKKNK